MKVYKLKKLVDGYRINPMFTGKTLVAVPDKYLAKGDFKVSYDGKYMVIKKNVKPLTYRSFEDKYGRGSTYLLMYFVWSPEIQKEAYVV